MAGILLVLAPACGGGSGPSPSGDLEQVQGIVVQVVARDLREVETLGVRDETGRLWTFTTREFAGLTPGHLREHQLFGTPVIVSYEEEGGRLVAVLVTDPSH